MRITLGTVSSFRILSFIACTLRNLLPVRGVPVATARCSFPARLPGFSIVPLRVSNRRPRLLPSIPAIPNALHLHQRLIHVCSLLPTDSPGRQSLCDTRIELPPRRLKICCALFQQSEVHVPTRVACRLEVGHELPDIRSVRFEIERKN